MRPLKSQRNKTNEQIPEKTKFQHNTQTSLIMKARGVGEEEAYALLRKTAMDQSKRVADVAQALVTASELLS